MTTPHSPEQPGSEPPIDAADAGPAEPTPPSGVDLARAALAQARADARRRGTAAAPARRRRDRGADRTRPTGDRDPQPLERAISGLLADRGWETEAAVHAVMSRWHTIVGDEVAAHCRPESYAGGELVVGADSAAWATQVRILAATLVRRLNEDLGHGTVQRVTVRGPSAARRRGAWRVAGRGDSD